MIEIILIAYGVMLGLLIHSWIERKDYIFWRDQSDESFKWSIELLEEVRLLKSENSWLRGKMGMPERDEHDD